MEVPTGGLQNVDDNTSFIGLLTFVPSSPFWWLRKETAQTTTKTAKNLEKWSTIVSKLESRFLTVWTKI